MPRSDLRAAASIADCGESATKASPFGSAKGAVASARNDDSRDAGRPSAGRRAPRAAARGPRPAITRPPRVATSSSSGRERRAEAREQALVDRHAHRDAPEHAAAVGHRHRANAAPGRRDPTCKPRAGHRGTRHARDDTAQRRARRAAQSPLEPRVGGELGRLGRGRVEPPLVPGDGRAQRGLQPGVDATGLAALRERVVAVERDRQRQEREQGEPEEELELEAAHQLVLKFLAAAADTCIQQSLSEGTGGIMRLSWAHAAAGALTAIVAAGLARHAVTPARAGSGPPDTDQPATRRLDDGRRRCEAGGEAARQGRAARRRSRHPRRSSRAWSSMPRLLPGRHLSLTRQSGTRSIASRLPASRS